MHQARKRFGQNFLYDPSVTQRILATIEAAPGEHLVEIGPGRGALTTGLLQAAGRLDAVELDRDLVEPLVRLCADLGELRVYCADALTFPFCDLAACGSKLRVVGNLPYNISTPILFHLLQHARCIRDIHCTLQREVVARMAAAPGGKIYGRLSVMLQAYCEVVPLFRIGRSAFRPIPKVESAFVRLRPYETLPVPVVNPEMFARIVTKAFGQRRKTLGNSLKGLLTAATIAELDIDPTQRPEQLSVKDFARLAQGACKTQHLP